ncbi:MAG: helix-turn-helix domain-containing protein [Candidatus Baltobacteraceae bacterium]
MLESKTPNFGAQLKQLRLEAGLSQEELAKRARISVQAVGAYERGTRRAPHRDTFALLAEGLNLTGEQYDRLLSAAERARLRGPDAPRATRNLPLQLTQLIGRDGDVRAIRTLVAERRLVTLAGTGGIGKTRVALEVASQLVADARDGVWFADLSALTDPALVAGTIAFALGIAQRADQPVLETLQRGVRDKELLLVLDNCEHLIDETARVADAVLRDAPGVKVLATSREALRIAGERVYRVPPLDVPTAVELFADSAATADQAFVLTDQNGPIVAEICRRLDGVALAIELAAARVTSLTPEQILNELDERFRILVSGSRTALPRQKTLRALIDWSYDLLGSEEQRLFRRLSVFAGGWTLPAATAISSDSGAFDVLGSLIDKSLVVAQVGLEEQRYDLLESIRVYAFDKLVRVGERDEIARRHAEYVASFAAAALGVDQYARRINVLRADVENIRSALRWCLGGDDRLAIAARILRDARTFLSQSLRGEFLAQTREVLRRAERLDPELRAEMLIQLSFLTVGAEALDAARGAAELLEGSGLRNLTLLRAYQRASYALAQVRRIPEALETNRRAIELHRDLGVTDPHTLRSLHYGQGYLLSHQLELRAAREAWGKARDLATAIGDTGRAAIAQCNIAEALYLEGDVEEAMRLAAECLEVFQREALIYWQALTLNNMAAYRLHMHDLRNAALDLLAAVEAVRRAGDDGLMLARSILHAATLAAALGDFQAAGELAGYSAAWFDARGFYDPGDERQSERLAAQLRGRLEDDEYVHLARRGAQLDERAAWEAARSIIARVAG